ncbi:Permease of the drug/metabolite transporter (DMT) superfamily [Rhizobium sp. RU35A]|uniref:DMT family transporter n=1 Tax=Rhizobium sp. RU35A TaxID=1907414 RepID=UPI000953EDD2|nr:DMT family transporter [Rhizobium sp. RU35A]SIQ99710.1 Permease of the drug/metabolite transporter (DMT) superfamily [Rhizobium sp. RU35A]
MSSSDSTLKGVLIAFLCFAAYSFSDAAVKLVEGRVPPFEAGFIGTLAGILAVPFLLKRGDSWRDMVRTTNRPLWLLRFLCSSIGTVGSIIAFTELSMAEAFCLIFLLPSFATIMSVIFLKEKVGAKRWAAVIVGFIGVLIVLRPGFRELSFGHVTALASGLTGAVSVIIYRYLGPSEKNISMYGAGLMGALVVCGLAMLPHLMVPTPKDLLLLIVFGVLAAVGTVLLMVASFYAPAAIVTPIQYSQMLWAILLGYLIFGDSVDLWMGLGIALIVGSGLLTLVRERKRGTALPPPVAGKTEAALAVKPEEEG